MHGLHDGQRPTRSSAMGESRTSEPGRTTPNETPLGYGTGVSVSRTSVRAAQRPRTVVRPDARDGAPPLDGFGYGEQLRRMHDRRRRAANLGRSGADRLERPIRSPAE